MTLLTFHSWVRPQNFYPIFAGWEVRTTPLISIRCLWCCLDWLIAHQRHNVTPGNWLDCPLSSISGCGVNSITQFSLGAEHHTLQRSWVLSWFADQRPKVIPCDATRLWLCRLSILGCSSDDTFTQNFLRQAWQVHGTPFIFIGGAVLILID